MESSSGTSTLKVSDSNIVNSKTDFQGGLLWAKGNNAILSVEAIGKVTAS